MLSQLRRMEHILVIDEPTLDEMEDFLEAVVSDMVEVGEIDVGVNGLSDEWISIDGEREESMLPSQAGYLCGINQFSACPVQNTCRKVRAVIVIVSIALKRYQYVVLVLKIKSSDPERLS